MEDGRKNNGGHKTAGRKPKIEEDKQKYIFSQAIKRITSNDDDDESKIDFLIDFALEKEGKKFIAEHVFGKAPQTINQTNTEVIPENIGVVFKKKK
tara:strand:- start:761 stop:1048 length:288 start_codon:yes stop_codon:yes gene_type:complete